MPESAKRNLTVKVKERQCADHKSHKISQGRVARGLRSENGEHDVQQHIDLAAS